jgi:hypothetical protein
MGKIYDKASFIIPTGPAYNSGELWGITRPSISDNGKMTFQRDSSTYRTTNCGINSIPANMPRIDYADGIPHISMQSETTNLIPYSRLNSGWIANAATLSGNNVPSPEFKINAVTVTSPNNNSTGEATVRTSIGTQPAGYYIVSFYLKPLGNNYALVQLWTGSQSTDLSIMFDIANKTITSGCVEYPNNGRGYIEDVGDGWVRASVGGYIAASSTLTAYVYLAQSSSTIAISNNSGNGVYVFGAQVERVSAEDDAGLIPNVYVPTNGSAASIVRDQGYQSAYTPTSQRVTVYGHIRLRNEWGNISSEQDANYNIFGFINGTTNQYGIYYWGANSDLFGFNTWNGDSYGISNSTIADGSWHKIVAVFDFSDFTKGELYIDGVKQSISQTLETTLQRSFAPFGLNSPNPSNQSPVCDYREVIVFDQELSETECITLSTL